MLDLVQPAVGGVHVATKGKPAAARVEMGLDPGALGVEVAPGGSNRLIGRGIDRPENGVLSVAARQQGRFGSPLQGGLIVDQVGRAVPFPLGAAEPAQVEFAADLANDQVEDSAAAGADQLRRGVELAHGPPAVLVARSVGAVRIETGPQPRQVAVEQVHAPG